MSFRYWYLSGLLICTVLNLQAQSLPQLGMKPARPNSGAGLTPDIRADVDLILVPVTVTNRAGATVNGLTASAFTVMDDKTPRPIASFGGEDVPVSVGVVMDLSGSMSSKWTVAEGALRSLFATTEPDDEAFLLSVASRPVTISDFTTDIGSLQSQMISTKTGGATALVDTVCLALTRMKNARNGRKAIVIISDGMDNHSRYSKSELMRLAEEADVQIYTIGMTPAVVGKAIDITEAQHGLMFLDSLAARTGGLSLTLASYQDPGILASKIGQAIRNQYVIGYLPLKGTTPGKWRPIHVKVSLPQTCISSRSGYYSR